MRITAKYLKTLGACSDQVAIVATEWPDGAPITVPSIKKAVRLGLDVDWLALVVLSPEALAEHNKARAPALAEYSKVRATALAEYNKVRATALAEYNKVRATAKAEYDKVRAPALVPLLRAALREG